MNHPESEEDYDDLDDEEGFDEEFDDEEFDERRERYNAWGEGADIDFQDPGGESALRRETPDNPRNCPCPTCERENMLTPKDVTLHYQCDICARETEGGY